MQAMVMVGIEGVDVAARVPFSEDTRLLPLCVAQRGNARAAAAVGGVGVGGGRLRWGTTRRSSGWRWSRPWRPAASASGGPAAAGAVPPPATAPQPAMDAKIENFLLLLLRNAGGWARVCGGGSGSRC